MKTPPIDLALAETFLEALGPKGLFTFQTFDDSDKKRDGLVRVIHAHSVYDRAAQALADLNALGAGVFVTINKTDGKARKAENITALRALFIDGDDIPRPATWHAKPDFLCWRDETHWHAYWKLAPEAPLNAFTDAQMRLIKLYRSDPKIKDLPRVMRVPGFLHRKGAPVMVQFEDWRSV